jgi:anti-sigma regulatory factor (Ser/Thr protein kinase)
MFLARLAELRRIGAFVEGYCADSGLARARCLRLNLVLEELFVNTVRHGHRGESEAPVWVILEAQPRAVHLTYEDTGPGFNPFAYRVQMGKIGGLGVLLTRELTAARDYTYLFGRNRIRLSLVR